MGEAARGQGCEPLRDRSWLGWWALEGFLEEVTTGLLQRERKGVSSRGGQRCHCSCPHRTPHL